MRLLSILVLALAVLSPSSQSQAADPQGAIAALRALPARYQNGVLRLSADEGDPNPLNWHIVARNSRDRSVPTNIIVARGEIVSERPTFNFRTLLGGPSPIDISRVRIDSTDVWQRALRFSSDRGRRLGSLSYRLEQKGRHAAPIWSVWCYDLSGRYIGFLSILATTGAVTASR